MGSESSKKAKSLEEQLFAEERLVVAKICRDVIGLLDREDTSSAQDCTAVLAVARFIVIGAVGSESSDVVVPALDKMITLMLSELIDQRKSEIAKYN